ncbi:hypothetical protein HDU79_008119 [Rhizoclosmatium sp. JEL0117]|nr:hypothetical protein HDU79_008119 [Rhizoclosmatium sp. JEL0117]
MFKRFTTKKAVETDETATKTTTTTTTTSDGVSTVTKTSVTATVSHNHIEGSRHPHISAIARGLRVPLTIWIVGYSTLSMLPKVVKNDRLYYRYSPGPVVIGLSRGELAYEPLFLLSGLAAGIELAEATPKGETIPGTWALVKFWASKIVAVLPPIVSVIASVLATAFQRGDGAEQHLSRVAHLFGAVTDCGFYLAAPWAFQTLLRADRGASPRLAIGSAILAGVISLVSSIRLGLHPATSASSAVPFAHAITPPRSAGAGLYAAVPLRFPAFFAGLALAAERERDGKGPSTQNQLIGLGISAALWTGLLFVSPNYGSAEFQQIFAAFRYPAAALASYLALRPLVTVPTEVVAATPWRRNLHKFLTHPTVEAVSSVILAAELVHREVFHLVFWVAEKNGFVLVKNAGDLTDLKVVGVWGVVVAGSLGVGYIIHKILQAPALKAVKGWFEKKRDKLH